MLQWMGGSRRKVATSRKSTQKRQKQYFEQRKRQQQRIVGLESSVEHKEHRSLDVLGWLNVSTSSQDNNCVCQNERQDLQFNGSTMRYHFTEGLQQKITNSATAADYVEVKESGTPLGYEMETACPKNNSFSAPDCHINASSGGNHETDVWNTSPEQQMSVFDLLTDDGPSGILEGGPIHEAHVAFSVEGLGKVGTQTPIHSPQPERSFHNRCSSPRKAARLNSKNFNYVLDDLEFEVDVMRPDVSLPLGGNHLEFSTGITNSCRKQKQKYSVVNDCTTFHGHGSEIKSSFDDSKIFYNIGKNNDDLWDVGSGVLDDDDDDFLSKKKHNISGPHAQKNRVSVIATDTYNILESPFQKQQISESNGDILTSERTGYPAVGRKFDLKEVTSQPDWSYSENAKDNLSLLSEESCSSSAVRGVEATNISPPNLMAKEWRKKHKNAFGSHDDIYGLQDVYTKKSKPWNRVNIHKESHILGSGKCTRMPVPTPSKSKQFHRFNSPFQDEFGREGSWLFEQGSTSVDTISGFSSSSQTSDTKVPTARCKAEMGDPFSRFPIRESHVDADLSFDESRYGGSVECSTFGCFLSEKPFSNLKGHDSPICSKVEVGPTEPKILNSESRGIPLESFHVAGSHGGRPFPNLVSQENVMKYEENKSKSWPANCEKFDPGEQSCSWNDYMLSDNGKATDASNSKDKIFECKEGEDGTLELKESVETADSPEHVEEISSSMKNLYKLESSVDHEENKHNAEIKLPRQNESEDLNAGTDDAGPERRNIVIKRQRNCVISSSPVTMLESYVVQLLCVQKVQMDVPAKDNMKQV